MINALVEEECHHFLLVYFHLECQAKAQGQEVQMQGEP